MIQISEPITLEKLLPLIQKLPKAERERLPTRHCSTRRNGVGDTKLLR